MPYDELREHWRKRLKTAKDRLDFARAFVEEVEQDMQSGSIPHHHGQEAYQRALRAEVLALHEYSRVLETFNKLIVHGEIPSEPRSGFNRDDSEPLAE
jgi:negative regulator of sigma E activity